jgi:hypothetical protein
MTQRAELKIIHKAQILDEYRLTPICHSSEAFLTEGSQLDISYTQPW